MKFTIIVVLLIFHSALCKESCDSYNMNQNRFCYPEFMPRNYGKSITKVLDNEGFGVDINIKTINHGSLIFLFEVFDEDMLNKIRNNPIPIEAKVDILQAYFNVYSRFAVMFIQSYFSISKNKVTKEIIKVKYDSIISREPLDDSLVERTKDSLVVKTNDLLLSQLLKISEAENESLGFDIFISFVSPQTKKRIYTVSLKNLEQQNLEDVSANAK